MATSLLLKVQDRLDGTIHHPEDRSSMYVGCREALREAVVVYQRHYLE